MAEGKIGNRKKREEILMPIYTIKSIKENGLSEANSAKINLVFQIWVSINSKTVASLSGGCVLKHFFFFLFFFFLLFLWAAPPAYGGFPG